MRRFVQSFAPLIAFSLIGVGCAALDPGPSGSLSGWVSSELGNVPLKAHVRAKGREATADSDGFFVLERLPAGWVDLTVEAIGHQPQTRRVRVEPGAKRVDFTLLKPQTPLPKAEILFEREGKIWVTDPLGIAPRPITPQTGWRHPVWAPDRKRWAALRDNALGFGEIWVVDQGFMDLWGKLPQKSFSVDWSREGDRFLVATAGTQGPGSQIFLVHRGEQPLPLSGIEAMDESPAWSPDSQHYAFSAYHNRPVVLDDPAGLVPQRGQIYIAKIKGGRRQVTTLGENRDPAWSPDGQRLAFVSNRSGSWEVWTMRPDGSDQRQITHTHSPGAAHPVWSPDGQWILFLSRATQGYQSRLPRELWRVEASTGQMKMVANDAGPASW